MKAIVLITCLVLFGSASAATKRNERIEIAQGLEDLVNDVLGHLANFDPISTSELNWNFLGISVNISNLNIEGFSKIVPEISINADLLSTSITLSATSQKLAASLGHWESNIPGIFGNGTAGVEINDALISLNVIFNTFGGFQPSVVNTKIGNANVHLTGFQNNEALSQQIADTANNALNVVFNSQEFRDKLENSVDDFFDNSVRSLRS